MANLFSFGTPFGEVNVGQDAAEDFQGLIEELARAGAPLKKIGSYDYRNIAGTNTLSEHAKGKAIDVGNQQARNVVDPEFRQWVEENPERYSQILQKYNMRGGESFRNPDLGHIEWRGEGAGNPMHEAAPLGGAMPSNYDTEDRTAVGLGGSRAYPEEEAVADATGRPRGILDMMGMPGQQQPGGLLGMLGDPETMAYLAMIAKGASPYSNLDPNSMLSNAHTVAMRKAALQQQQAEHARDNARADRALGLREQEYGLQREDRQARDAALFEERQQKRDLATKQKEVDDEVRRNLGGGGPARAEDGVASAPPVPEGTRSPEDQIAQYQAELAKNPSPALAKSIERKIEQLQKGPPASTLNLITKAENEIAPLQATKDKLERMQTLLPNILEGPLSGIAGTVSQYGPAAWRNPKATDTLEFNNLAQIETIRDMSRTMKGSTAIKEMDVWLSKAADPKLPIEIRQSNLKLATDAVNREIAIRENRVKELREGTYGRKQTPRTDEGGGGGSVGDPLGIR